MLAPVGQQVRVNGLKIRTVSVRIRLGAPHYMMTFSPDKFGFYRVGKKTTYSKYEAAEWSNRSGEKLEWDFNRKVFDAIDWKQEPDGDLWEMYKDRARQIRAAYDYVVLWYSGGSDSHNILCAWIDAGLKIDEIATSWNYEASGDKLDHFNAEITNVVLPDIKMLQEKFEFKFRLVDTSEFYIELFDLWKTGFEFNINHAFSPNNPIRNILRDKIIDYKNIIDQGKKLCFVWGKEKPMLDYSYENNSHYSTFYDSVDDCVGPYIQQNYHKGWYDELFYWTPDFPLIVVKQAHVVKNFINYCEESSCFVSQKSMAGHSKKFNKTLREEVRKKLIYPKWSNDIFCNGKSSSKTYSLRDEWFFKSNLDLKNRFIDITNSYYKIVDPINKSREQIRPMHSGRYLLE